MNKKIGFLIAISFLIAHSSVAEKSNGRTPASVVIEDFQGTFTSPPRDPAEILISGKTAVDIMKSRWLWSEKGEKKSAKMTVIFSCESEERCTLAFPKN